MKTAVWEVMPELNQRSICGKIVINSTKKIEPLKRHKTGEVWHSCQECSRAFLDPERLMKHNREHEMEIKNQSKKKSRKSVTSQSQSASVGESNQVQHETEELVEAEVSYCCVADTDSFVCLICLQEFSTSKDYLFHSRTHLPAHLHKCHLCGANFRLKAYVRKHLKISHAPQNKFGCQHCSCRFESPRGLTRHTQFYHKAIPHTSQSIRMNSSDRAPIVLNQTKKISSVVGNLTQSSNFILNAVTSKPKDMNVKKKLLIPPKSSISTENALHRGHSSTSNKSIYGEFLNSRQVLNDAPYECRICHKFLTTIGGLKNHLMVHSGERPYLCKHCGMRFRLFSTLFSHIKNTHYGNGTFHCAFCNCSFKSQGSLTRHAVQLHPNQNN